MKYSRVLMYYLLLASFSLFSIHLSAGKAVWRDEAFSVLLSQLSVVDIISVSTQDFSPPLFYLILHFWHTTVGTGALELRVLPLLFSLATIGLLYSVRPLVFTSLSLSDNRKILVFDRKIPLLESLYYILVTCNSVIVYFSLELRGYSLLMFLILLWTVLAYCLTKKRSALLISVLALTSSALMYTHNLGLIWLVIGGVGVLIVSILNKNKLLLWRFVPVYLLAGISYLPWLGVMLSQAQNVQQSFWLVFHPLHSLAEYSGLITINEQVEPLKPFYGVLAILGLWLSLLGLVKAVKQTNFLQFVGVLFFVTVIAFYGTSIFGNPILYKRYISFLSPHAIILLFTGLVTLYQRLPRIAVVSGLVFIVLVLLVMNDYRLGLSKTHYQELQRMSSVEIFTDEAVDVMPCLYYHPKCWFVGNPKNTPHYIGTTQLPTIVSITSWADVKQSTFFVLYRKQLSQEAASALAAQYVPIKNAISLGDDVYLQRYIGKI